MIAQAGGLPDAAFACVGGGSNAIGLFYPMLGDDTELIGVEAGGTGSGLGQNAATLATGTPGVLQGSYTMILQDDDGQVQETHSISAGLDYSGVGPEHALLQATGRVKYVAAGDDDALAALEELCETEGILTALETSHAYVAAREWAKENPGKRLLIGNSGRGDKDMPTLTKYPVRTRSHESA
jgi:tryptophan synthase beta chain